MTDKVYREYIDCLNARQIDDLGKYVDEQVTHNNNLIGLDGYKQMIRQDYEDIPDLKFTIAKLVVQGESVAARLKFVCTPKLFMGMEVNRKVVFFEHVFYDFKDGKIIRVNSLIDKHAIEKQL